MTAYTRRTCFLFLKYYAFKLTFLTLVSVTFVRSNIVENFLIIHHRILQTRVKAQWNSLQCGTLYSDLFATRGLQISLKKVLISLKLNSNYRFGIILPVSLMSDC